MSDALLAARIPEQGFADPDQALEAFLGWAEDTGLSLYAHQEEAILELMSGQHVVLNTPTGSGKSLVALALHFQTFAACGRTVYTAPIKALVSEKFFALCELLGAENVGLMTGDGAVNREAPILCCTAEILANIALREGDEAGIDSVVMDEFHYYADRDRGMAWQIPLLVLKKTRFLLMSATLGDTAQIRADLTEQTGVEAVEVRSSERPVPLEHSYSLKPVHETIDALLEGGRAPIYIVHFTQRSAAEQAQALMSTNVCTKDEKAEILAEVRGTRFDSPFGKTVRRFVLHGVGLHHAGLLPRYRMLVERLAQKGLLKVICGTDTLGVGINVPIRTVLFTKLCKYDGQKMRLLRVRDFQQIAGRAGRAGFDTVGYVLAQAPGHIIDNRRAAEKAAAKGKRKSKSKAPPDRGYKHWDQATFERLSTGAPEVLLSRFEVDHGRLLSLMQHAEEAHGDARLGVDVLLGLIQRSHATAKDKERLAEKTSVLVEDLTAGGVLQVDEDGRLRLVAGLQRDFSLHHSLSLFLVGALEGLDPQEDGHALDTISLTESILEQPRAVLMQQQNKAREALHWKLKGEGVPYEDRIEQLQQVSWPMPQGEWITALFQAYASQHPWVQGEDIRPKCVVRELVEQHMSFSGYVVEYGLERSEGVLLRYLSQAYKALLNNVPADKQTEPLIEMLATLRAMLARVDSTLVTEWERLAGSDGTQTADEPVAIDISQDKKRFHARIRAELHALVRALSLGDWEEAASSISGSDEPVDPAEIEAMVSGFVEEFGPVRFDHSSRLAQHTSIRPVGRLQWEVSQRLPDPEDEGAWAIEGSIDLREDANPPGPLLRLRRIGE